MTDFQVEPETRLRRIHEETTASASNAGAVTVQLPQVGAWDLTVSALVNGSTDHGMLARGRVVYSDQTNDLLFAEAEGAVAKCTGSNRGLANVTFGTPNAAGEVVITATWLYGSAQSCKFIVYAMYRGPFGY